MIINYLMIVIQMILFGVW